MVLDGIHRLFESIGAGASPGEVSRSLAATLCEVTGASSSVVFLRDVSGQRMTLSGWAGGIPLLEAESAAAFSAENLEDPFVYCMHAGEPRHFDLSHPIRLSEPVAGLFSGAEELFIFPLAAPGKKVIGAAGLVCGKMNNGTMERALAVCLYGSAVLDALIEKRKSSFLAESLQNDLRRVGASNIAEQQAVGKLLGKSPFTENLRKIILKVAHGNAPVLLTGPTGSGKSFVARIIHEAGGRRDSPFVEANCGELAPSLLESELLGYKKGSFTGAVTDSLGLFKSADSGSIFLDEVTEIPVSLQSSLLFVLQERKVRAIGANTPVPVDVRVIAATNRDMELAMQQGSFRKDLFHRLAVVHIPFLPLAERKEDILPLAISFLEQECVRQGKEVLRLGTKAALNLQDYSFPGNVRELGGMIERAVLFAEDGTKEITTELLFGNENGPRFVWGSLKGYLEQQEKNLVQSILGLCDGDVALCAETLGAHKKKIYRIIEKYSLSRK